MTQQFRLFLDGDQWCAVGPDFTNLQESPAGFGDDMEDAIAALSKQIGQPLEIRQFAIDFDHERRKRECDRYDDCESGIGICWCLNPAAPGSKINDIRADLSQIMRKDR